MVTLRFLKKQTAEDQKILKRLLALFQKHNKRLFKKLPKRIHIVEVSPTFSKKLNRIYRKKNKPANVLSFVYDRSYAEIILTPGIIRKEAKKSRQSFKKALGRMIIHGMIHCSGLDHERSKSEERKSEVLERKLLSSI